MAKLSKTGSVIWITGLSGAGKTTVSKILAQNLRKKDFNVILLDGDKLREIFEPDHENEKKYQKNKRVELALKYSKLSQALSLQGFTIVIATISLYTEIHEWNAKNLPRYFETYLCVPIEELRKRDTKGIYHKYDSGKISDVVGLDLKFDQPFNPTLKINFNEKLNAKQTASIIEKKYHEFLKKRPDV